MISFSNGIGDAVAPLGISYDQCLESIEALASQYLIEADKMLGPRWQLKGIPDYVWLEEEHRSGVDVEGLTRQMLSDIVNRPDAPRSIDWGNYHGAHWRTVLAILKQFQAAEYLTVTVTMGGPYVTHVTTLAKRALREMN